MAPNFKNFSIDVVGKKTKNRFNQTRDKNNIMAGYSAVKKLIRISFYTVIILNFLLFYSKSINVTLLSNIFDSKVYICWSLINVIISIILYKLTKPNLIGFLDPISRSKRVKYFVGYFFEYFCALMVTMYVVPHNLVYIVPSEIQTYTTVYKMTSPGPSRGKHGHYKNGIKIYEKYTGDRFFLPFDKSDNKQYPPKLSVQIKNNIFGSYLVSYRFYDK